MNYLLEDRRNDLVAQGKRGEREKGDGKTRYEKRVKSRIASTVREYNQIDMQSLYKYNILTVQVPVVGETGNYLVRIKFGSFLDTLQDQIERQNGKLDLRAVTRALLEAFNRDDVYIYCTCDDWKYRMGFWASMSKINSGPPERRPSKITNPKNNLGPGCKHVMLVLANTSWLIKVASVIWNYINYMEKHQKKLYTDIMYPAIYGKKYEEPVQLTIDDEEELANTLSGDTSKVDIANTEGRTRGQFKAGNRYRFKPNERPGTVDQISIEDIEIEENKNKTTPCFSSTGGGR